MDLFREKCETVPTPAVKLLDPLKFLVTSCSEEMEAVAVVQEMEDGTFRLNNVFHQPLHGPKFDIVLPEWYASNTELCMTCICLHVESDC